MKRTLLRHFVYVGVFALYSLLIGCPLRRIFGLTCPLCGMTRAHLALLCGDLAGAMAYHSLFFLGLPAVIGAAHLRVLRRHRAAFIADVVFVSAAVVALAVRYVCTFV